MRFVVERTSGGVADLVASGVPAPSSRLVRLHTVDRPALVLGSTQPVEAADAAACRAQGVRVVHRRSGGGAVLLDPGEVVWIDVVIPARDPLWESDIGRAFWWLGDVWGRAIATLPPFCGGYVGLSPRKPPQNEPIAVNRGPSVASPWSDLVCFAGLGPGEVTVDGRKAAGMAQRRSRDGALFQTAALLRWDAERLAGLLALAEDDRSHLARDLEHAVAPLTGTMVADVEQAVLGALEALAQ